MFFASSATNSLAIVKSMFAPNAPIETAMDGMFDRSPSIAAATVPEYVMSSPRFAPRLMPLTMRSGFCFKNPRTARRTQSVGDPSVMNAAWPVRRRVGRQRSGRKSVMLWEAPLQFRSGAMMSTSPSAARASTSGPRASLSMPSSFVMRMCFVTSPRPAHPP